MLVSIALTIVIRSNDYEKGYLYDDGVKKKTAYRNISEDQYG